MKYLLILCLVLLPAALRADPVTLTNSEAYRLFIACRATQAGLTAVNAVRLAQDINLLRPLAEAVDAKQAELQTRLALAAKAPDKDAQAVAIQKEAQALGSDKVTLDLRMVTFSDQEVVDAKIAPDSLAEFLRFLTAAPTKK